MIMKMAYGILMALFFAISPMGMVVPGYAQDRPPSIGDIVAKMQSKLNLTQDQVAAVMPIIEKYSSKREELRQSMKDGTADRDSIRSQMKELKTDEGQELAQVLSSDQMSQWKSMMSRQKRKPSSEGGGNGVGSSGSGG